MRRTFNRLNKKVRRVTARRRPPITEARKQELHDGNSSESNISSLSSFGSFNSNSSNSSVKSTESDFANPVGKNSPGYVPGTPSGNSFNYFDFPIRGKIVPLKLNPNNSPNINEAKITNFTEVKRISTRRTRKSKPKRKPKSPQKTRSSGRKLRGKPERPGTPRGRKRSKK